MLIQKETRVIFLGLLAFFVVNKFLLRPFILSTTTNTPLHIFTLSVPNFVEAVVGSFVIAGIFWQIRNRLSTLPGRVSNTHLFAFATVLAGIYVVTQELKWHNLGGRNVFDPYDLWASVIGLIVAFLLLQRYSPGPSEPS